MPLKKELELYIHIPFCVKKCAYCDFLSGTAGAEEIARYIVALCKEINQYGYMKKQYEVTTIFIGGGTPSILEPEQIARIMASLKAQFFIRTDAEITIEVNPGTITREKVLSYRTEGINRISIGLQSVNNEELKILGRIHTYEEFLDTYALIRECGFQNVNIDLISAVPGQTESTWEVTLEAIIQLNPEHISAYSLIIEEGTPFYEVYGEDGNQKEEGLPALPCEEEERTMYERTKELLEKAGYLRYEISNYAKEGYVCRHNLGYWDRTSYLGIGVGAASLIEDVRYSNIRDRKLYETISGDIEQLRVNEEVLTREERIEEFMFLGLRKTGGISKQRFAEEFGISMDYIYKDILAELEKNHLICQQEDNIRLTSRGVDISNYVFAQLVGI